MEIAYAGDVMTDASAVPITAHLPGTDVDILNDENINGLELALSSS